MTAGDRLRKKIGVALPAFGQAAWRIWDSPAIATLYPEYLCTMHCIVRSSVPLMHAAIERAHELGGDPVATGVAAYLTEHVGEETGHDEWVLQDLAVAGWDRDEPLRRIPPASIASVVGAQYYWIRHHHPVALMGHIAVMEGYPPSPRLGAELQRRTGFGRDAFRSLRRHSSLDVHHRDEFFEVLDRLPLDARDEALIGLSALHTVRGLIDVFDEIYERGTAAARATA